ncbi:MAG: hypothetical protein H0W68_12260, partial [Gemmatimonadaceae bacterium]|nr:hypothetical protein [Gemmatimonadaceae bacterium]
MNHVAVLWLVAIAMASLARWSTVGDPTLWRRPALVLGASLGIAFTVRPLDAVLIGGVIAVAQAVLLRADSRRLRSVLWQIMAGLVPVALLAIVHIRTTGAPFRFGYEVLYGKAHELGFHVDPYGSVHTPLRAATFVSKYLARLSVSLFEWPLPALGLLGAGLLAIRRPSRWDFVLVGLILAQVAGYAMYWHEGDFRGPRFLFSALPAVTILFVRAHRQLARRVPGTRARVVRLLVPICLILSWTTWQLSVGALRRAHDLRIAPIAARVDADSVARASNVHHALVFVAERWPSRLIRRLWALDMDRASAMRLMYTGEFCSVQQAIETEEAVPRAKIAGRLQRLAAIASAGRIDAVTFARCRAEAARDNEGTANFAPFLASNTIDHDGRIGGDVVYALDLGPRNELLRARFGDRSWYRFAPRRTAGHLAPELFPYPAANATDSPR